VLDGETAPPIFGPCLLCQTVGWTKMPLCTEVGLGPDDIVLDGDPAPPKKGHSTPPPLFGPCLFGQTAGRIKMPLGMEVDLGQCHFVIDGDPAPERGTAAPLFSAHVYCGQTIAGLSYCWALVIQWDPNYIMGSRGKHLHHDLSTKPQQLREGGTVDTHCLKNLIGYVKIYRRSLRLGSPEPPGQLSYTPSL